MRKRKKNVYLIGMMGTGKSTIGQQVASELSLNFYDTDVEIEKKSGKSVSEIFATEGEEEFRKHEQHFIENGHPDSDSIVSCGGGLCVISGMLERLKAKGTVICLWASPDVIFERIKNDRGRPLLQVEEPKKEIQRIIDQRKEYYLQADLVIDCKNLSIRKVSQQVIAAVCDID